MNEADEAKIAEDTRLEKLKGGRNPTRAQQNYVPPPPTPEEIQVMAAEWERIERIKRGFPLPPRPEPDFAERQREQLERDRRKEKLINATGGRIE